eukprot:g48621.t1
MGNKAQREAASPQETEGLVSNNEKADIENQAGSAAARHTSPWNSLKDATSKSFSRISSTKDGEASGSGWSFFTQSDEDTSPWAKCGMSRTQRLYGFVCCLMLGLLCSALSSLFVGMILIRPIKFAFPYTLGSLLSIGSTTFLVGPSRQLRTMFDPIRRWASMTYLTSLFATLYFAVIEHSGTLTLAMLAIQFMSFIWYSASYIPYARTVILSCLTRVRGCLCF